MFWKLFKQMITGYIFFISFIVSALVTLLRGLGVFRAFFAGIWGGISFVMVWAILLKILQFLLSKNELNTIFKLAPAEENISESNLYIDDDKNDLTIEEIYQNNSENENNLNTPSEINYLDSIDFNNIDYTESSNTSSPHVSDIGADGKFDLTVGEKTVRATPKDGAQASRKLLRDE